MIIYVKLMIDLMIRIISSALCHPRQLNVLFGMLTNNSLRTVFMDQLQDIVVANADSTVRGGPPRKAMPKGMPKITFETSGPFDGSNTLQTFEKQHCVETKCGYFCDTTAATTTSTEEPSEL